MYIGKSRFNHSLKQKYIINQMTGMRGKRAKERTHIANKVCNFRNHTNQNSVVDLSGQRRKIV